MESATIGVKDLARSLDTVRFTPLSKILLSQADEVVRHIVKSDSDVVPAVTVAAFSSSI